MLKLDDAVPIPRTPPIYVEDAIDRYAPGVDVPNPILVFVVSNDKRGVAVVEVARVQAFTAAGITDVALFANDKVPALKFTISPLASPKSAEPVISKLPEVVVALPTPRPSVI